MTHYEEILNAIVTVGKPLQRKEIRELLDIDDNVLGVILHNSISKGMLYMLKHPKIPAFYMLPSWTVAEGNPKRIKLIKQFDPFTKQWIENGIKDQSVGIPNP